MPKCLAIDKKTGRIVEKKITLPVLADGEYLFQYLTDDGRSWENDGEDYILLKFLDIPECSYNFGPFKIPI